MIWSDIHSVASPTSTHPSSHACSGWGYTGISSPRILTCVARPGVHAFVFRTPHAGDKVGAANGCLPSIALNDKSRAVEKSVVVSTSFAEILQQHAAAKSPRAREKVGRDVELPVLANSNAPRQRSGWAAELARAGVAAGVPRLEPIDRASNRGGPPTRPQYETKWLTSGHPERAPTVYRCESNGNHFQSTRTPGAVGEYVLFDAENSVSCCLSMSSDARSGDCDQYVSVAHGGAVDNGKTRGFITADGKLHRPPMPGVIDRINSRAQEVARHLAERERFLEERTRGTIGA